jgi:hypothetical protein
MSDTKKPPKKPARRTFSAVFEPFRPSLGPGPAARLPPPKARSVASMDPIKVPGKEVPSEQDLAAADAGSITAPIVSPDASVPDAIGPSDPPPGVPTGAAPRESLPPSKASLAPPSLSPRPPRTGSWRTWLALLGASLVAVVVVLARPRRGETSRPATAGPAHVGAFSATLDVRRFQRGSIHTHTTRSDGRQSPREVAAWYREHGYQFVAITDHNVLVDPAELADLEGPGFALIPGEEISSTVSSTPVHVQALCIDHLIPGGHFDTPLQALSSMVAAVRAQNGIAVVNHPNFSWAFGLTDVAPLTGSYALEIWSGHPAVYSMGDATHPSHETMWDELLTRGRRVTAVAVDDVHNLDPVEGGAKGLPGLGWIQTFGELGRAAVCDALAKGRYYASSGVAFRRIRIEEGRFTVWVEDAADTIVFLGSATQVLGTVTGDAFVHDADGFAASYSLHGGEAYVRVQAKAADGKAAWTQAYFTSP